MTVATIRTKLQAYMAEADDKKVKALYNLLESDIEKNTSFVLTKEHIRSLDEEHELHISGKSKSYSWREAKEIIRGKKLL